jgi:hypothetical protein
MRLTATIEVKTVGLASRLGLLQRSNRPAKFVVLTMAKRKSS